MMKTFKAFFLTISLVAFSSVLSFGQSFDSYFKYEGVKLLAELAHPTSSMKNGYFKVYKEAVDVEIYYTDGVYTYIRLWYDNNGWFNKVEVLKDTDWFPPFLGIELIKDVVYEASREYDNSSSVQSSYEKWLGKAIIDFSGKDMTLVAMTISSKAY